MSSPAAPSTPSAPWAVGATDPGLDAVESLFRGSTGRSGLRSYEPSLRPPEGIEDYSWLYRTEAPVVPAPDHGAPAPALVDTGPRWVTSAGAAAAPARRWRAVALLAVALGCALLLPLVLPTV